MICPLYKAGILSDPEVGGVAKDNKAAQCDEGDCAWWICFTYEEGGQCALVKIADKV